MTECVPTKSEIFRLVHWAARDIEAETNGTRTPDVMTIREAAFRILHLTERFVEPLREPLDQKEPTK